MRRHFATVVILLVAGWIPALPAAPEEGFSPEQARSGSLLFRMQQGYRVATRLNTSIRIDVSGLTVRTTIVQAFRNDGNDWVEGVYVFPLPEGAAVDRMRLRIGERIIEGEVREKREAEASYQKAKKAGRKASVVRQQRANLFTTSVANVAPGETVEIEIGYLDTARFDDETFSLRVPMTLTPRYIPGAPTGDRTGSGWSADTDRVPDASLITPPMVASSRDHRVTLEARINAGMPLEFVASRYHPVTVESSADRYDVRFSGTNVAMDHDFELLWRPVRHAAPRAMLFRETVNDESHLLLMVVPPNDRASGITVAPRELVLVVDTSGSMHGVSIEQAKKALLHGLDGLRPSDHFNVIQFNSATSALFPASLPATPANVATARDYVRGLQANGGTEMRPALLAALRGDPQAERLKQVIFVTDGSVGNEDELFALIESRLGAARLFTVGIGSAPNGWFMRKAAEAGRGTFETISALHEVGEKMSRLLGKLERPMVTDLDTTWSDGLSPEVYPETIPDLYAGEPVLLRARLARAPENGDRLRISGKLSGGDWSAELAIADADPGPGTAAVWARAHIDALMDEARRGGDASGLREAVIATALKHQLVSKYTSFVAVDKTPARPRDATLAREQVPNLMPHGQSMQAIFGFPATATAAPVYRRNGALLVALGTIVLFLNVWTLRGRPRGGDGKPDGD